MTLEYPVQLGIPPTACYVRTDEPEILLAFTKFLLQMNDTTAAFFLNIVNKVNPEWVEPAKQVIQNCLSLIGGA